MLNVVAIIATVLAAQSDCVFLTGQSVATGYQATPALSTTQTLGNTRLPTTLYSGSATAISAVDSPWPAASLVEVTGETPASGMANTYAALTGRNVMVFGNAWPAQGYSAMARGTVPWTQFERQVESWGARTASPAQCFAVAINGESDATNSNFATNLATWQTDIDAKIRASSNVKNPVLLFLTQNGSCTIGAHASMSTCVSPIQQYNAARNGTGLIKMVGPRHQYTYVAASAHPDNTSSRKHGCKIGEALASGSAWQPLWPVLYTPMPTVARNGAVITLTLYTPSPPLVYDNTTVTGISATTRGFEYTDDSSPPAISSVDCSAACSGNMCSCTITLASTPTGASKKLRYAYSGTSGNTPGPTSGMRGPYRDSATTLCSDGTAMPNWLVSFEEVVP